MPSYSVTKERFGAPWPCALHIKVWVLYWNLSEFSKIQNWEQQWKIGSRTSEQQQQMEKAAAKQQQKEVMEEGEITTDEESEIGNTGKTLAEVIDWLLIILIAILQQAKIVTLVHSRELLQEVICPWENVQLFIRHFADHSPLHNFLAIFRIDEKMNLGENLVSFFGIGS
jgi:hypothetical protein